MPNAGSMQGHFMDMGRFGREFVWGVLIVGWAVACGGEGGESTQHPPNGGDAGASAVAPDGASTQLRGDAAPDGGPGAPDAEPEAPPSCFRLETLAIDGTGGGCGFGFVECYPWGVRQAHFSMNCFTTTPGDAGSEVTCTCENDRSEPIAALPTSTTTTGIARGDACTADKSKLLPVVRRVCGIEVSTK